MSRSLPGQPDLDRLRRAARELRAAARAGRPDALNRFAGQVNGPVDADVTLAQAQWIIAREHGFASWARLRAYARPDSARPAVADELLAAAVDGREAHALRLLAADPGLSADLSVAAAVGDVAAVESALATEPGAALRPDGRRDWPPLLYVCHSHLHRADPYVADGLLQAAWLLLDAGASPNTEVGGRTALDGAAGIAGNAAVAALLLRHGADPDGGADGDVLRRAAAAPDPACLRLLLDYGGRVEGTGALAAAVVAGNAVAVRLLLDHGADPGRPGSVGHEGRLPGGSPHPLPLAAAGCGPDVVGALLDAGADPDAPGVDGVAALRAAVRAGNPEVARLLTRRGAVDDATEADRFLGACLRGDRVGVQKLLAVSPDLPGRLSADDLAALVPAAGRADPAAVRLLLDLGFPVSTRDRDGATALHAAASAGRADVVAELLAAGADPRATDRWGDDPLAAATAGSGRAVATAGTDWAAVVRALLAAGADPHRAWVPGRPPSERVAAVLAGYGVAEPDPDDVE